MHGASARQAGESAPAWVCLENLRDELALLWRAVAPDYAGPGASLQLRCALEAAVIEPLARPGGAADEEAAQYQARRLAKLYFPLPRLSQAWTDLRLWIRLALEARRTPRTVQLLAALERRDERRLFAATRAYDAVQSGAFAALLAAMEAEHAARDGNDLMQRLLGCAVEAFHARWAGILLCQPDGRLRHHAWFGLPPRSLAETMEPFDGGKFFQACLRRPGLVLDAANDPRLAHAGFRAWDIKTIWAAPLRLPAAPAALPGGADHLHQNGNGSAIGVLHVDFDHIYEYLPQELDLLQALAGRSALAIERTRLIGQLRQNQKQLHTFSRQLWLAQEDERRRIQRELHDESGQRLMALRLRLELVRRRLPAGQTPPLNAALREVDETADGIRRVMARLAPAGLEHLDLVTVLRRDLARLRRQHGLRAEWRGNGAARALPAAVQTVLYRIAQEALTNVIKHARASRVRVGIQRVRDQVELLIEDDGVGLPAPSPAVGPAADGASPAPDSAAGRRLGLAGIRERLELANGGLELTPAGRRGGLRLRCWLPLDENAAPALAPASREI